ncbi:MAG: hypothetical protein ACKVOU_13565 [Cytophagales bacterium]
MRLKLSSIEEKAKHGRLKLSYIEEKAKHRRLKLSTIEEKAKHRRLKLSSVAESLRTAAGSFRLWAKRQSTGVWQFRTTFTRILVV